jgi:hypothetical protein
MTSHPARLPYSLDPLIAEAKQRARRRRMLLAAALVLVGAAAAAGVVETRSPATSNVALLAASWHDAQICRGAPSPGIAVTSNTRLGKVLGLIGFPMRVSMGFATASGIARRVGPSEFQPAATHGATAQAVPCNVALDVADRAGNRWGALEQRQFGITAGWAGYSGGPQFGFECVLRDAGVRRLLGSCVHEPSRREGAVSVRFLIRRPA